jgi:thiamine pyrophosphokinase
MTVRTSGRARRALILSHGSPPSRTELDAAWPGWAEGIDLVVAADGGARFASMLGLSTDIWVGDGDSLTASELSGLRASGVQVNLAHRAKDESDTELAVLAAVEAGAVDLTLLGALGGPRFDHSLANVALLAHPALVGRRARLLDPAARVALLRAPGREGGAVTHDLRGPVGGLVTLLPFGGEVLGVTTQGLRFPLREEALQVGPARGLSNVREEEDAAVTARFGLLLVIEGPATLLS